MIVTTTFRESTKYQGKTAPLITLSFRTQDMYVGVIKYFFGSRETNPLAGINIV